jgi:hypothetical protein
MAKQTFTTGQVLTAAQMTSLQQTAMGGGSTTAKTTNYTLVAADAGTVVQMNSASATTITVNTALFAAGDTVQIQNIGAGVCTITAGTATVNTSATLALSQYDAGSLYFNTTSAAFFFNSDAADSVTQNQIAGKNALINGDFLINQRGFTSNTSTGSYNFDRWLQQNSGGSFTVTPQTFTPGAAPIATYEGRSYVQGITATQSAAGDYAIITQRIEDVTRYAGTTVTVSFFGKANTGTPKIGVEVQQNFGSGGSPSATVSTPGNAVTLSTSWARYSVTIAVPSISGKTLGTTVNTSYLELNLWTSSGATNATRASSIGIQNFTASIWGVQLEYASAATYFTTATNTLAGELAAAQRYYYQSSNQTWTNLQYQANVAVSRGGTLFLPQFMRVAPTLTLFDSPGNSGKVSVSAASGGYSDNITPSMFGTDSLNSYAYYVGGSYVLGYTSKITASAEL